MYVFFIPEWFKLMIKRLPFVRDIWVHFLGRSGVSVELCVFNVTNVSRQRLRWRMSTSWQAKRRAVRVAPLSSAGPRGDTVLIRSQQKTPGPPGLGTTWLGSEIRRFISSWGKGCWNPMIYNVFCTSKRWLFGISEPSTVCITYCFGGGALNITGNSGLNWWYCIHVFVMFKPGIYSKPWWKLEIDSKKSQR